MTKFLKKLPLVAVVFLFCLIIALISGCSGSASHDTGTVKGECMASSLGKYPLVPASSVLVTHVGSGLSTLTDEEGKFTLSGIPAGRGIFTFEKAGYSPITSEIVVQPNMTITLQEDVYLQVNPVTGKKAWTVFVYIAADNSLSDEVFGNLNELESIGSTNDVNIVAFVDMPDVTSKFYYIKKDNDPNHINSPYYDYGSNLNSGDVDIFQDIAAQTMADYPAEHVLVDLWDHGSGIERTRGICCDDTSNSCMTEVALSPALATLKSMHGKNLDIIACDACLMATMEVAYQWKDYCDYLVASENEIPGKGFPYATAYGPVIEDHDITALTFAKDIVQAYGEYYAVHGQGVETLSAINMSKIGNLNTLLDNYSKALRANGDPSVIWTEAYRKTIFFGDADLRDLYSFPLLEKNYNNDRGYADAEAQAVIDAIVPVGDSKVVVANYYGMAFEDYFHMVPGGISIWGLYTGTIPENSPYRLCDFFKDNDWHNLIDFLNSNH